MMPIFAIGAAGGDDAVELVGGDPGDHCGALMLLQARFLFENAVGRADVQAARRHRKIAGATGAMRSSEASTTAVDSMVSLMHFRPTQTPA